MKLLFQLYTASLTDAYLFIVCSSIAARVCNGMALEGSRSQSVR